MILIKLLVNDLLVDSFTNEDLSAVVEGIKAEFELDTLSAVVADDTMNLEIPNYWEKYK